MPNLYAIGAAAIVILGLLTWGMWEKATIADYKTQIEKMNGEMAAAKAAHDIAIAELNTQLEKDHAERQQDINQKNGDLDKLAGDVDRLRAASRACRNVIMQAPAVVAPAAPRDSDKPAATVSRMVGSYAELNAIMKQCFDVANYGQEGHDWAVNPAVSK